jgi:hypothetical protein
VSPFSAPRTDARRAKRTPLEQPKLAPAGPVGVGAVSLLLGFGAWALTAVVILSNAGSRTFFGLDEGIYLGGAARVLVGSPPYRDFLSFVGPASFLEYAAALSIDHSLLLAHLVLATVIGLTSGVMVYLSAMSARSITRVTAVAVLGGLLWLGELEFWPNKIYVNHRWECTAMTLLALALARAALHRQSRLIALLSGCALGMAVTYTPSAILFAGAMVGYFMLQGGVRLILAVGCGFAIPLLAAAAWLVSTHSMGPFFDDMAWAFHHYPQPNATPYGYIGVGAAQTAAWLTRQSLAHFIAFRVTAALPVVAAALLLVLLFARRSHETLGLLLVLCAAVAMLTPRFSGDQLLFASPIAIYCIAYSVLELGRMNRWILYAAGMIGLASAGLLFAESKGPPSRVTEVRTALGTVVCRPGDAAQLQPILDRVGTEDSLFVYPYFPLLYALTGARNPTSYLFVQPGMMDDDDMAKAARELRRDLPKYVVHVPLPEAAIRRNWPGTQRITSTGPIDEVVAEHYRLDITIPPQGVEVFVRK